MKLKELEDELSSKATIGVMIHMAILIMTIPLCALLVDMPSVIKHMHIPGVPEIDQGTVEMTSVILITTVIMSSAYMMVKILQITFRD
jgi:hypothetical protein